MSKRKAHVKRYYGGRNWVDVLRIDELPVNFQSTVFGKQGQFIKFKFYWGDGPDPNDPNSQLPPNTARKTSSYTVPDPFEDQDDPKSKGGPTFDIIERMKITMPSGQQADDSGRANQVVAYVYNNAVPGNRDNKPIGKRKVKIYKVYYNDLGDTDGKRDRKLSDGVDWDTYKEWLKDDKAYINRSCYLPVEFPDSFVVSFGADASNGWQGQDIRFNFSNKEIVEALKVGDPIEQMNDPHTEGLIRIDPMEIIINHSYTAIAGWTIVRVDDLQTQCSPPTDNGPLAINTLVWAPSLPFYSDPGFYIFKDGPGKIALDTTIVKQNIWADGKIHLSQVCTVFGSGTLTATLYGPDNLEKPGMVKMSPNSWSAGPWQYRIASSGGPDFDPCSLDETKGGSLQGPDGPIVIPRFPGDPKPYKVVGTLTITFSQYGNSIGGPNLQWWGGPPPGYVPPAATIPGGDAYAYYPLWPPETEHIFSYGGADDTVAIPLSQDPNFRTPKVGSGSITVSGSVFKCGGKSYQAKGTIIDPDTNFPPFSFGVHASFYCERVDPDS